MEGEWWRDEFLDLDYETWSTKNTLGGQMRNYKWRIMLKIWSLSKNRYECSLRLETGSNFCRDLMNFEDLIFSDWNLHEKGVGRDKNYCWFFDVCHCCESCLILEKCSINNDFDPLLFPLQMICLSCYETCFVVDEKWGVRLCTVNMELSYFLRVQTNDDGATCKNILEMVDVGVF